MLAGAWGALVAHLRPFSWRPPPRQPRTELPGGHLSASAAWQVRGPARGCVCTRDVGLAELRSPGSAGIPATFERGVTETATCDAPVCGTRGVPLYPHLPMPRASADPRPTDACAGSPSEAFPVPAEAASCPSPAFAGPRSTQDRPRGQPGLRRHLFTLPRKLELRVETPAGQGGLTQGPAATGESA